MIGLPIVTQGFRKTEALLLLGGVFQICGIVVFVLVSWKQSWRRGWGRGIYGRGLRVETTPPFTFHWLELYVLITPFTTCVTWGELLNISVPQIPCL